MRRSAWLDHIQVRLIHVTVCAIEKLGADEVERPAFRGEAGPASESDGVAVGPARDRVPVGHRVAVVRVARASGADADELGVTGRCLRSVST